LNTISKKEQELCPQKTRKQELLIILNNRYRHNDERPNAAEKDHHPWVGHGKDGSNEKRLVPNRAYISPGQIIDNSYGVAAIMFRSGRLV